MNKLEIFPLEGREELTQETDLAAWIAERYTPENGDVLVVSSKVISKVEGHLVRCADVKPSDFAHVLAERTHHDPAADQCRHQ